VRPRATSRSNRRSTSCPTNCRSTRSSCGYSTTRKFIRSPVCPGRARRCENAFSRAPNDSAGQSAIRASGPCATAINNNGQIVGAIYLSTGSDAAVYSNGVWTDLGAFPGAVGTKATGINLAGQIVGTAVFRQVSYEPPIPGKHVPFIVSNGALVDLNTLIPTNTGFTLTDALGINGSGQIVCDATNSSGFTHAVLLTPK